MSSTVHHKQQQTDTDKRLTPVPDCLVDDDSSAESNEHRCAATGTNSASGNTKHTDDGVATNTNTAVGCQKSFSAVRRRLPVQENSGTVGSRKSFVSLAQNSNVTATSTVNALTDSGVGTNVPSNATVATFAKKSGKANDTIVDQKQNSLQILQTATAPVRKAIEANHEDFEAANELLFMFGKASAALDTTATISSTMTSSKHVSPPYHSAQQKLGHPHLASETNPSTALSVIDESIAIYTSGTGTIMDTKNITSGKPLSRQGPLAAAAPLGKSQAANIVEMEKLQLLRNVPNHPVSTNVASAVRPVPNPAGNFKHNAAASFPLLNKPTGRPGQIIDPLPCDILCGQDKTFSKHFGNQLLRMKIIETVPKYQDILRIPSVIGKKKKATEMYKDIVILMKATGSRFLRLVQSPLPTKSAALGSTSTDNVCVVRYWHEISDKLARDKVSHALRTYMKKYVTGNSSLHGGACADGTTYRNFNYLNDMKVSVNHQARDVDMDDYDDDLDKQISDINRQYNQNILRQHQMGVDDSRRDTSNDKKNSFKDSADIIASHSQQQQYSNAIAAAISERKANVSYNRLALPKTIIATKPTPVPDNRNINKYTIAYANMNTNTSHDDDDDDDVGGAADDSVVEKDDDDDDDDDESFSYGDDDEKDFDELYQQQQDLYRQMVHKSPMPTPLPMAQKVYK